MSNPNKVGLVFGTVLALFHLAWALLVLSGMAQAMYDFILWAHMLHLPLIIGPFELTAAVSLVAMTFVIGYVMGYIGSLVWNRFHR